MRDIRKAQLSRIIGVRKSKILLYKIIYIYATLSALPYNFGRECMRLCQKDGTATHLWPYIQKEVVLLFIKDTSCSKSILYHVKLRKIPPNNGI